MLKVGVIGTGYLGRHHARVYSLLEGVKLAGVADTEISRARETGALYGAPAFSDFRKLVEEVDAVSVVTPTGTHHEIALHCLRAGRDVLVEKPLAASLREADSLVDEAARKNLIMQVGHIERFNPVTESCFSIMEEVSSIESERVSPFEGRAADVDVTLDLMIHDIDIALAALGSPRVRKLRAEGSSSVTGNLDEASAWVEFENGASARFRASRVAPVRRRVMRVFEKSNKRIFIELDFMERKIYAYSSENERTGLDTAPGEPLREELKSFVECVLGRRAPRVGGPEGRNALELALMVSEKIRGSVPA